MNTQNAQPLEWSALWAAMKDAPHAWILTTAEMYSAMLEVLPPRDMRGGSFLVGEADHHNSTGHAVYACFKTSPNGVHASYMSLAEFRAG